MPRPLKEPDLSHTKLGDNVDQFFADEEHITKKDWEKVDEFTEMHKDKYEDIEDRWNKPKQKDPYEDASMNFYENEAFILNASFDNDFIVNSFDEF